MLNRAIAGLAALKDVTAVTDYPHFPMIDSGSRGLAAPALVFEVASGRISSVSSQKRLLYCFLGSPQDQAQEIQPCEDN
jgi:hypothetical protein